MLIFLLLKSNYIVFKNKLDQSILCNSATAIKNALTQTPLSLCFYLNKKKK